MNFEYKLEEAKKTIEKCIGKNGFYASYDSYYGEYWIRDLIYSMKTLLNLGYKNLIKKNLIIFLENQKKSGEIPFKITNINIPSSIYSIFNYIRRPRTPIFSTPPKLLYPFIPDSTILTIIGIYEYSNIHNDKEILQTYEKKIIKALAFLEKKSNKKLNFIIGPDWRDAMENYKNKYVFCNQILLFRMYQLIGENNKAEKIKKNINNIFWKGKLGHYIDYIGNENHIDVFGHALALIYDIPSEKYFEKIIISIKKASTEFGYRNLWPPYKEEICNQKPNTYQNSTIWPFIQGYVIIAFKKIGLKEEAKKEFIKFTNLKGFNEWYSPINGKPLGSMHQLWSAALYLQAYEILINKNDIY
jgi:glycogen debranching enzyme